MNHGGPDLCRGHVVQQDELRTGGQGFVELVERVDLDLDANAVSGGRLGGAEGGGDTAGRGDVVVLDEDGVEESDAVVDAATQGDGVLVQGAEAGDGLAGVEDRGAGSLNLVDECAGARGDTAEALEEVEGGAFAGEGQAGVGFDVARDVAGLKLRAFRADVIEGFGVAELAVDLVNNRHSGEGERLAGGEGGAKARLLGDHGPAGEIAVADVFGQGEFDRPGNGRVGRRRGVHAEPAAPRKRMRRLA